MTEFKNIPFEFISTSLTDYQKKSIEIKYEVISKVSNAKNRRNKEAVFYNLAIKLNVEYQTVRNIYYSLTKNLKK